MLQLIQVIFFSLLCGFGVISQARQEQIQPPLPVQRQPHIPLQPPAQVQQAQTTEPAREASASPAQPQEASASQEVAPQAQAQAEPAAEQPPQPDGKTLYTTKGCLACHGADGNKPLAPTYPKIAGQNYDYTLNQLKDFKSGARNNGQAVIMVGMVTPLTDEDMKQIATHLTTPAEAAATVDTAPAPAEGATLYFDKACIACHGAGGDIPVMNAYPKISGQSEPYLLAQMKDIKSGARNNSHAVAMTNIMTGVTDDEMATLAKWLSAQVR